MVFSERLDGNAGARLHKPQLEDVVCTWSFPEPGSSAVSLVRAVAPIGAGCRLIPALQSASFRGRDSPHVCAISQSEQAAIATAQG